MLQIWHLHKSRINRKSTEMLFSVTEPVKETLNRPGNGKAEKAIRYSRHPYVNPFMRRP